MMTDTSGARSPDCEPEPDVVVMKYSSSLAVITVRSLGVRGFRSRGQEGLQIATISFRRSWLIVDDAREASTRVAGASFPSKRIGHVLHELHPVAAEFP